MQLACARRSIVDPPASISLQESLQTAGGITQSLNQQNESLQTSLDHVQSEEYFLTKGDRLLRGMGSWSGWAYNTFVKGERKELRGMSAQQRHRRFTGGGDRGREEYVYTGSDTTALEALDLLRSLRANEALIPRAETDEERDALRGVVEGIRRRLLNLGEGVGDGLRAVSFAKGEARVGGGLGRDELMSGAGPASVTGGASVDYGKGGGGASAQQVQILQQQDQELASLSLGLTQLKGMSVAISDSLVEQSETIDDIDRAAGRCEEKARRVVRRAGRMNQRSGWAKEKEIFVGWVTVSFGGEGGRR